MSKIMSNQNHYGYRKTLGQNRQSSPKKPSSGIKITMISEIFADLDPKALFHHLDFDSTSF
jgi:hypothetical protein